MRPDGARRACALRLESGEQRAKEGAAALFRCRAVGFWGVCDIMGLADHDVDHDADHDADGVNCL